MRGDVCQEVYGGGPYEAELKAAGFKKVRTIEVAPNTGERSGSEYCRAPLDGSSAWAPVSVALLSSALVLAGIVTCAIAFRRRSAERDGSGRPARVIGLLGPAAAFGALLLSAWPLLKQLRHGFYSVELVVAIGVGFVAIAVAQILALRRVGLPSWFWVALSVVAVSSGVACGAFLIESTLERVLVLPEGTDLEFRTAAAAEMLGDAFRCTLFGTLGALGVLCAGNKTQGPLQTAWVVSLGAALVLWMRVHALDEAWKETHFEDRAEYLSHAVAHEWWILAGASVLVPLTTALNRVDRRETRSLLISSLGVATLGLLLSRAEFGVRHFATWFREIERVSLLSLPEGIPKAKASPSAKLGPAYVVAITKTSFVDFDRAPFSLSAPPPKPPRIRPDSVPTLIVERTTTYQHLEAEMSKFLGSERKLRLLLSRGESKFDVAWAPPPKPALGSIAIQVVPKLEELEAWSDFAGLMQPPIWFALDGVTITLFADNFIAELKIGESKPAATDEITKWLTKGWANPPVLVAFVTPTSSAKDLVNAVLTLTPTLPFGDGPEPRFSKLVVTSDRSSIKKAYKQARFELDQKRLGSPASWRYCPKGCAWEKTADTPW